MNNRDALYTEYKDLERDMRSISPKLELHKKMAKRLEDLKKALNGHDLIMKDKEKTFFKKRQILMSKSKKTLSTTGEIKTVVTGV